MRILSMVVAPVMVFKHGGQDRDVPQIEDLRRALPFASWPQPALQRVVERSQMRWHEAGAVLCRAFEPPGNLWIVTEGSLEMCKVSSEGRRYLADLLAPPQVAGLTPMLDGRPNMFDTVVRERARLISCPREAILAELEADAGLAMAMVRVLCTRTRMDNDRLWITSVDPVLIQVAKIILYMGRRPGLLDSDDNPLPMQVTYEDIADFLGLSRSAVVRVGLELIAAGAVRKSYRGVVIADADCLLGIAERREPLNPLAREYISAAPRG